jgi:hypothetical protein
MFVYSWALFCTFWVYLIQSFIKFLLSHPWWHKQPQETQGHIPENKDEFPQHTFVFSQITTIVKHTVLCFLLILFKNFNICILTLLLHIYNINSHYCIFLCQVPLWRWPKNAETCTRTTTRLYIIVFNYSAVVGIYTMNAVGVYFWKRSLPCRIFCD